MRSPESLLSFLPLFPDFAVKSTNHISDTMSMPVPNPYHPPSLVPPVSPMNTVPGTPGPFTTPARSEGAHWTQSRTALDKYDNAILDGWKDEINTQLLVASLLAAVTASFIIESQKDLSEDPAKTAAVLLSFIAMQFNGSASPPSTSIDLFNRAPPIARAITSLFYVSLALSLANVTLGLLSLQWIRDLTFEPPGILNKDFLHFRCVRYDGFRKWGGKGVIVVLPVLLLLSLGTFFAGLLIYVSDMDWTVAIPLYVVLTGVFAIMAFTTVIPSIVVVFHTSFHSAGDKSAFTSMPPFRSLQSWIALQVVIYGFRILRAALGFQTYDSFRSLQHCPDWGRVDQLWMRWFSNLKERSIIAPLVLSTSNPEDVENVARCYEEIDPTVQRSSPDATRLRVLRKFVDFGEDLPPYTLGQVTNQLIDHLVLMVHRRRPIEDFGTFSTEDKMGKLLIEVESVDPIVKLTYAAIEICKMMVPFEDMGPFNLLWNTLRRAMVDFEGALRVSAPTMIMRAFDAYYNAVNSNPAIAEKTPNLQGFQDFVSLFVQEIHGYRNFWTAEDDGVKIGRAILCHPLWEELRTNANKSSNPSRELRDLRMRLTELDRVKGQYLSKEALPVTPAEGQPEKVDSPTSTSKAGEPSSPGSPALRSGTQMTQASVRTEETRRSSGHGAVPPPQHPPARSSGSGSQTQQRELSLGQGPVTGFRAGPVMESQTQDLRQYPPPPAVPHIPYVGHTQYYGTPSAIPIFSVPHVPLQPMTQPSLGQSWLPGAPMPQPSFPASPTFLSQRGSDGVAEGPVMPDSAVQMADTPVQSSPLTTRPTPVMDETLWSAGSSSGFASGADPLPVSSP